MNRSVHHTARLVTSRYLLLIDGATNELARVTERPNRCATLGGHDQGLSQSLDSV